MRSTTSARRSIVSGLTDRAAVMSMQTGQERQLDGILPDGEPTSADVS